MYEGQADAWLLNGHTMMVVSGIRASAFWFVSGAPGYKPFLGVAMMSGHTAAGPAQSWRDCGWGDRWWSDQTVAMNGQRPQSGRGLRWDQMNQSNNVEVMRRGYYCS